MLENLSKFEIILASQSPRRQNLLRELGFNFKIVNKAIEENYPSTLKNEDIALFLAELKAKNHETDLDGNYLLITADTIVCLENEIIGKPKDKTDAINILSKLSGKMHTVLTGVCISTRNKRESFLAKTNVFFKDLSQSEISFYIEKYKPYDKAGAYGIQEWIGYIGIEKIEGSYFNVMGLPIQRLYEELRMF
ncbi:MAG: septum formation protein Maf [Bacteroidetes bacterium]|jgi:septum formation protein|nr:septum formation protein Maf [Bacteroidota bacterium]MBT6686802.1 septum formation protein Maf [Bacteroidota bacterium]MBT7144132.1 septum formation protein Maf [Bacteroidota bacterium]MBT7490068.1 septum formation protein Maf [Bacteroidota bacterium]